MRVGNQSKIVDLPASQVCKKEGVKEPLALDIDLNHVDATRMCSNLEGQLPTFRNQTELQVSGEF